MKFMSFYITITVDLRDSYQPPQKQRILTFVCFCSEQKILNRPTATSGRAASLKLMSSSLYPSVVGTQLYPVYRLPFILHTVICLKGILQQVLMGMDANNIIPTTTMNNC